jgi:hypothetical protein
LQTGAGIRQAQRVAGLTAAWAFEKVESGDPTFSKAHANVNL